MAGKQLRRWLLGLTCTVMPLAGCAQPQLKPTGGLFSWFRSRPLTEREQIQQERSQATKSLNDPGHLHLKYAQWRENVGDLADARLSYQSALKENPRSLEAKLGLARLDQLSGRTAEAEKGFQDALNSRPDDPQALNALGQFYASQKQWSKSLPLLEQAADAAPAELNYRYHLAVALSQSGDINAAFPHFKQALGEAEAHYNVGYLLHEKGHTALARQRFQQALALNPRLMQAQAMLDEIDDQNKTTAVAQAPTTIAPQPQRAIQQATFHQTTPVTHNQEPERTSELPHWPAMRQQTPTTTAQQHLAPQVFEQPAARVHNPPAFTEPAPGQSPSAFRPTQPKNWESTEHSNAAEYLPPYQPQAAANPPKAPATVSTPPITPAQKEQWENQTKSSGH